MYWYFCHKSYCLCCIGAQKVSQHNDLTISWRRTFWMMEVLCPTAAMVRSSTQPPVTNHTLCQGQVRLPEHPHFHFLCLFCEVTDKLYPTKNTNFCNCSSFIVGWIQERHQPVGTNPKEGHQDDYRGGAPLLWASSVFLKLTKRKKEVFFISKSGELQN